MSIATNFRPAASTAFQSPLKFNPHRSSLSSPSPISHQLRLTTAAPLCLSQSRKGKRAVLALSAGSGGDDGGNGKFLSGGGGGGDNDGDRNRDESILVLAQLGQSLNSLLEDLVAAIESGKIPGSIVETYLELEKSPLMRWLFQFAGFKERFLADDLFLAKVGIEIGIGLFTKTAAEYPWRGEKFFKEPEIVLADVVTAIIADFMRVHLPNLALSPRSPMYLTAGTVTMNQLWEQRPLELMLHPHKLVRNPVYFAVRTGHTFFRSLLDPTRLLKLLQFVFDKRGSLPTFKYALKCSSLKIYRVDQKITLGKGGELDKATGAVGKLIAKDKKSD